MLADRLNRHGRSQNLKVRIDEHRMQKVLNDPKESIRKGGHILVQWFSNNADLRITGGLHPDQVNQNQ